MLFPRVRGSYFTVTCVTNILLPLATMRSDEAHIKSMTLRHFNAARELSNVALRERWCDDRIPRRNVKLDCVFFFPDVSRIFIVYSAIMLLVNFPLFWYLYGVERNHSLIYSSYN